MIKRKIIAIAFTLVISVILITIFLPPSGLLGEQRDILSDLYISLLYVLIGLIVYGFPITLLIEILTSKFKDARFFFAFSFHLIAGLLPFFMLYFLTVYSIGTAFILFIVDELCRDKFENKKRY